MDKRFAKVVMKKVESVEANGYDSLSDSDVKDILDECDRRHIPYTRQDIIEAGLEGESVVETFLWKQHSIDNESKNFILEALDNLANQYRPIFGFKDNFKQGIYTGLTMARDKIAELQSKPKIISLKEVKSFPEETDLYCEIKDQKRIFATTTPLAPTILCGAKEGNVRFWTLRPTAEQRLENPWK